MGDRHLGRIYPRVSALSAVFPLSVWFRPKAGLGHSSSTQELYESLISAVGELSGDVMQFLNQRELRMVAQDPLDDRPIFFRLDAARRIH
jgi:hypothetical protein